MPRRQIGYVGAPVVNPDPFAALRAYQEFATAPQVSADAMTDQFLAQRQQQSSARAQQRAQFEALSADLAKHNIGVQQANDIAEAPDPLEFLQIQEQFNEQLNPALEHVELGGSTELDKAVSDALLSASRVKGRRFAANYLALTDKLADPHLGAHQKQDLQRQFMLLHPEAGSLKPLTAEQRAELKRQKTLADEEARTGTPMAFDHRGQLTVHPGYTAAREREKEMQALERQERSERISAATALARLRSKRLGAKPTRKEFENSMTGVADEQSFQRATADWNDALSREIEATEISFGLRAPASNDSGEQPAPSSPAPRQPVQLLDADDLADGLSSRKWRAGTLLELDGFRAIVNDDQSSVTPLQEEQ